ncbi:PD-(D/E)XK nuclease family protein [Candidatus Poribacteria bacterium]|nr:PD-(D/E)XK nuclease family protein [Candidatus Poribacteria bacterium]
MEISISRLRTYLACPQLYRYRYVLLEKPEFTSADMAFGEAMHFAIAEYHCSKNNLTADRMFAEWQRYWDALVKDAEEHQREVRFRSLEGAKLVEKAKALCEEYVSQFAAAKADDVELLFQVPLLDPTTGAGSLDHTLTGRIDLVSNRCLYEFKTAGRSYSQGEADISVQLTAYALAYESISTAGLRSICIW